MIQRFAKPTSLLVNILSLRDSLCDILLALLCLFSASVLGLFALCLHCLLLLNFHRHLLLQQLGNVLSEPRILARC